MKTKLIVDERDVIQVFGENEALSIITIRFRLIQEHTFRFGWANINNCLHNLVRKGYLKRNIALFNLTETGKKKQRTEFRD